VRLLALKLKPSRRWNFISSERVSAYMPNFRILVDQVEAITKRQKPPMGHAPAVAPAISVDLRLDTRLFNPKNW
jgi:hypothetical protein